MEKPNCMTCEHLRCDPGDAWTPTTYYCDMGEEDIENGECTAYKYFDALMYLEEEKNRKHDAQLRRFDKDDR